MANYTVEDLRNIVLLGHAGTGKTSLAEAFLHKTAATNRLGNVEDKSSILDCDAEEKEAGNSIDSGLCHINYNGKEINIIDTPGYPDYLGAAMSAMCGAETAVIVISANVGIQTNTLKLFQVAKDLGMACIIVINKIDGSADALASLVSNIQDVFGRECVLANVASSDGSSVIDCIHQDSGDGGFADVSEAHTNLLETIIEIDETLMESYLGGEEISKDVLATAFTKAVTNRTVIPIVFTSARNETGIAELLDLINDGSPSPVNGRKAQLVTGEGEEATTSEIEPDPKASPVGVVIRVSSDPKTNIKQSTVRLLAGTIKSDSSLQRLGGKKGMRCGHVNKLQGDRLDEIPDGIAGDIVTMAKLEELKTLDTVYVGKESGKVVNPTLPVPMFSLALESKNQGDEGKISEALADNTHADPTFTVTHDNQTNETVISGLGEMQVRSILGRMQKRRGLEVNTKPPQIPYRETITGSAQMVEYTHKKQSGGSGQYARVFIDMEPTERGEGYEFIDKIFGGSIDQPFRPSVDKGCQAAMNMGVLAGFPVVDVRVKLVDGKTHPVDSKDIAFQFAGREAFRKAFMACSPALLEPIVNMEVTVPSDNVGDITGDLASRRGRVQGQDVMPGNMTAIKAQVPLSEIQQYNSQLKSVTSGQGSYAMELSHYEPVPPNVMQQIVAQRKTASQGGSN